MSNQLYRRQLRQLAQAMAVPNRQCDVSAALAEHFTAEQVKLFVDGNLDKRVEKLTKQLSFVTEACEDFATLLMEFMRDNPLTAYDTGTTDGERMLAWLQQAKRLSAEQRDYVACQRARHAIEELARSRRLQHVTFQERYSLVDTFLEELETNHSLRIFLNPIRTWTRFHTRSLLNGEADPPANVLFFAVGGDVATAIFELEGQALINELADYQPCALLEWTTETTFHDREDLADFVRDLAGMGLVSLG